MLAAPEMGCVGVLGTGRQARLQALTALDHAPESRLHIWGRRREAADGLRAQLRRDRPPADIEVVGSVPDVAADADVLILATASRRPIMRGEWLRRARERRMIVRTWSCSVARDDTVAVAAHIERTGLVAYRAVDGYLGGYLFAPLRACGTNGPDARDLLALVWVSIERFAGPGPHRAVLYDEDSAFDMRSETEAQHYEPLGHDDLLPHPRTDRDDV
jgi:hypothetical protein